VPLPASAEAAVAPCRLDDDGTRPLGQERLREWVPLRLTEELDALTFRAGGPPTTLRPYWLGQCVVFEACGPLAVHPSYIRLQAGERVLSSLDSATLFRVEDGGLSCQHSEGAATRYKLCCDEQGRVQAECDGGKQLAIEAVATSAGCIALYAWPWAEAVQSLPRKSVLPALRLAAAG